MPTRNVWRAALCTVIFSYGSLIVAQAPDTLWTRTYGGSGFEMGRVVHQTPDSGYIILSTISDSVVEGEICLLKIDALGDSQWTNVYGGQFWDAGNAMEATADGGYIVTGCTERPGPSLDLWLLRLNAQGDTLWTKKYGAGNGDDIGYDVKQTVDNGFIVTGITGSYGAGYNDVWLLKTDASGDTLWAKTFGGTGQDEGYSVIQAADGGYIIAGFTTSYGAGAEDVWLIRTDSLGDTLRTVTYGGFATDAATEIQPTVDGGYLILAATYSYGAGESDVWMIKTDSNLDTSWTRFYGGSGTDIGRSMIQVHDNEYVIAGYCQAVSMPADAWSIKIDSPGDPIWEWTLGGNDDDFLSDVEQTYDNGYIYVGYTYSYGMGFTDVWLVKTRPDTLGLAEDQFRFNSKIPLDIYPNPSNEQCVIKYMLPQAGHIAIAMYDATGRSVRNIIDGTQDQGAHQLRIKMVDLPSGVYFIQLKTHDVSEMKKILIVR